MEPTKQGVPGDPSSSQQQPQPQAADLEARLQAMRLGGDPSSLQLQLRHRAGAATSSDPAMEPNNYRRRGASSSDDLAIDHQALLHALGLYDPSSPATSSDPAMEPNNYGHRRASSSDDPAVDHAALHYALGLDDPSSSLHPLNAQQVLAPTATPDTRLLPPHHEARRYDAAEQLRRKTVDWLSGVSSRSCNFAAAPTPSMAPKRIELSASAEEFRFRPMPWSRSFIARQGRTSGATDPFSARNGDASLDPYRRVSMPHQSPPTLGKEDVRDRLLQGSTRNSLVMDSVSSAHVVALLAEGDATVRQCVIHCVTPIVHRVMDERYPLFHALLNSCDRRVNELEDIIGAVCNGTGFAMKFDISGDKWKALKELIGVVAWNRSLSKTLIHGLICKEQLMVQREGPVVLDHLFTTLTYEDCSVIFEYTLGAGAIDEIVTSRFGCKCMEMCLVNARNGDLEDLEATILPRIKSFATGCKWSAYFLQRVLHCGREQLKARIVDRVAQDVVELSMDKFGCFVVEECFLSMGLQRVLDAFLGLSDDDLAVTVQGRYSNYVVQMLLEAGKKHLAMRATELARRIEGLPEIVRKQKFAMHVMLAIKKYFPRSRSRKR